ncbi:Protein phosphatase 1 regulatory inhibitor subunit PPP1R7 [Phytophthora citrophthora]|uniref:Protein phosphatase 1 regulatory inhibitor subunit PPP1R7 n=1 Tax=Phytophthora citrophthora TaxID=4793 RepID=A0AAD9G9D4_9STRA|nr:Protein phosphatase 1 regulatory inhibitor subunit PPP1R7 [Phytophthora citrophthora]
MCCCAEQFNCLSSLSELQKLTELHSLDISHNSVESLQEVATLSNLLVLKCSSNRITDLSWLAGLNHLEELWVRDNRIANAQLAHLQQLTALQTLVIHPNPCTERDDYVYSLTPFSFLH